MFAGKEKKSVAERWESLGSLEKEIILALYAITRSGLYLDVAAHTLTSRGIIDAPQIQIQEGMESLIKEGILAVVPIKGRDTVCITTYYWNFLDNIHDD